MKIRIRSQKTRLVLMIPTRLLCSRMAASITAKALSASVPSVSLCSEDLYRICRAIRKYRKDVGRLNLVDIQTAEGEIIQISL